MWLNARVSGGDIRLGFSSPSRWRRSPVFAFHHCDSTRAYRVSANGAVLGTWRGEELEKAIKVPFDATK
jgi:hypothetical protein